MKNRVQASLILLIVPVFIHLSASTDCHNSTHDIAVCDGDNALFSWLCQNLPLNLVRTSTWTLSKINGQGHVLASMSSGDTVTFSREYFDRMMARGTSEVLLRNVGILDSGTYLSKAELGNGTVIENHLTLTVQIPPLLKEIKAELSEDNPRKGCQKITCGHVIFPGFPPVSFQWNTPKGPQKEVTTDGRSVLHGCPLLPGNYTCQLTGPALTCGNRSIGLALLEAASVQISSDVEADKAKLAAKKAGEDQRELILVIVVPIVTVSFPIVILLLWVLKHYLTDTKGYSTVKKDHHEAGLPSPKKQPVTRDALVKVTLTGVSVAARPPIDSIVQTPASPSSPDTAPLTSSIDDPAEEEVEKDEKEEAEAEEEAAKSEAESQDDADPSVPLMNAEVDLEDTEETRI